MFVVAIDKKKELTATPIIWLKTTETKTGYYWPLYGLHFKLKNYVPLPVQSQELKNGWRYVPCRILLNGEKFKTYLDAEKALLKILEEGKRRNSLGATKENEVQSSEVETNEVQSKDVESDEEQSVEPKSVDVVSDEMVEQQADEVVEQQSDELVEEESDELVKEESDEVVEQQSDEVVEQQSDEVVEQQSDEVVEQQSDEVVEQQSYEVVEQKSDEVVEQQSDEVVQQQSDEVVEQQSDEVVEHQSDEVVEQQSDEVVEQQSYEDDENFENLPLEEFKYFKANEVFLEKKNGFNQLKEFYVNINESSERKFFNECVKRTFSDSFFLANITFKKNAKRKNEEDWVGVFDETRLYKCLKKAVVEKLKLKELDESKLKAKFVANFDRIKRAIRARP